MQDITTHVNNEQEWQALVERFRTQDQTLFETQQRRKDGSLMVRDGINDKAKPADRPAIIALATSKQRNDPNTPVVIEGDKGVQYEKITEVMNALYTAKIKRVGLAVKPAN